MSRYYSPKIGRVVFIFRFVNWSNYSFAPRAREKKTICKNKIKQFTSGSFEFGLLSMIS